MTEQPVLEICGLSISYDEIAAVRDVSFDIAAGESVALVGDSGSGKTQTALAVLGLLPANAAVRGRICHRGTELTGADEKTLDRVRAARIAMIFQDPTLALNPFLTVGNQLRRIVQAHARGRRAEADRRVTEMLARSGLPDPERQSRSYPHELSGGMRQRVMIAAALIAEPDLLIADEPTTALDVTVQAQILELLESLRADTALLLITHDLGIVAGHCSRMLILDGGQLVEGGATRDLFAKPTHAATARLLAAATRLRSRSGPPAAAGAALLDIDSAIVAYPGRRRGNGALEAVSGVTLAVAAGETLAVVGESGSGKTSLVRGILGLVPLAAGRVVLDKRQLPVDLDARDVSIRREFALVFQNPTGSLNPQMRVLDIVVEPLIVHEPALDVAARHERAATMLKRVGLGAEYAHRFPHELSGGEAQRVAIARALIAEPRVLVCDEAVAALDGSVREQILELMRKEQASSGLAIIFISHDLAVVRSISHRVAVMYMGRVFELAANDALFRRPRHPYTRALIDAVPTPDPCAKPPQPLPGEVASLHTPPPGCVFHPRCRFARDDCRSTVPDLRDVNGTLVACHRAVELDLGADRVDG